MNKILCSFICLLFISNMAHLSVSSVGSINNIIFVDDDNVDGPWEGTKDHPYQFIQDGIDNAIDGDNILVHSGVYYERVKINKTLQLIGIDSEGGKPVIDSNNSGDIFIILADGCTIDSIIVQNAGCSYSNYNAGFIINAKDCIIKNCVSRGNSYDGICIKPQNRADNAIIINNTIDVKINGIVMPYKPSGGSYYIQIIGNTISNTSYGIALYASRHNTLLKNKITSNYRGLLIQYGGYNEIIENTISNNKEYGFILYWNDYSNIIDGNTIHSNSGRGLFLNYNYGKIEVIRNVIYSNHGCGLRLYDNKDRIIISENNIYLNEDGGIHLSLSSNCNIFLNTIKNNKPFGLCVANSDNTKIYKNNFMNKRNAKFLSSHSNWTNNYWNRPRLLPKIIIGRESLLLPAVQFDLSPALIPYNTRDITT